MTWHDRNNMLLYKNMFLFCCPYLKFTSYYLSGSKILSHYSQDVNEIDETDVRFNDKAMRELKCIYITI